MLDNPSAIKHNTYAIKYNDLYVREYGLSLYSLTAYLSDVAVFMVMPSRDTLIAIRDQIGLPGVSALTVVEWAITETVYTPPE